MTFNKYYLLLPLFLLYFALFPWLRRPPAAQVTLVDRANATFYMLARNSDVDGAVASITQIETRFNHKFKYPYVFLNDIPFDDQFKL